MDVKLIEGLMEAIAPLIKEHVEAKIAPLNARIVELEKGGIRYLGVFQRAIDYRRGSVVTDAGSAWVALTDNPQNTPGHSSDWQLMVKAGKDAK
ncbi:hypothetical protein [Bradyrhizobium sp. JYMT SZCCT0428]|uniref:hypothetical protein n=1 Tax=Bradyrhizobium sp. JYMT SZCCT0428 TaxID=2807673 RepID=UPI001BA570F1|nr:hypothetical protein [Bradyrhizobium sp. JYMT SZCCT0428]MBR1154513.1 hypothetical protein [Bradyrhizobium sp. JYMT SZCCT0428]